MLCISLKNAYSNAWSNALDILITAFGLKTVFSYFIQFSFSCYGRKAQFYMSRWCLVTCITIYFDLFNCISFWQRKAIELLLIFSTYFKVFVLHIEGIEERTIVKCVQTLYESICIINHVSWLFLTLSKLRKRFPKFLTEADVPVPK